MHKSMFTLYIFFVCMAFYDGYAENVTESVVETTQANSVSTGITGSVSTVITSTVQPTPNISCETFNNDCKGCVQNSQCYYCDENNECHFYILKSMVDGKCNMKHAYFHTCKLNLEVMLIIVGVLSGIAVLIILILCCYCCCKRKGIKISKDDLKWARQREERKQIAAERRKERAERTEEIRKKYVKQETKESRNRLETHPLEGIPGNNKTTSSIFMLQSGLVKDSNPYQKFDA